MQDQQEPVTVEPAPATTEARPRDYKGKHRGTGAGK